MLRELWKVMRALGRRAGSSRGGEGAEDDDNHPNQPTSHQRQAQQLQHKELEPLYGFDGDLFLMSAPELYQDYLDPGFLTQTDTHEDKSKELNRHRDFFVLGQAGTGLVMHRHWEAWNTVVHGKKHWFLYPPDITPPLQFPVTVSIQEWLSTIYPEIKRQAGGGSKQVPLPLECTQHAGQLIYIPEGWYHATVNLVETIGVARQIQHNMELPQPTLNASAMYWRIAAMENGDGRDDITAMEGTLRALALLPQDALALADLCAIYMELNEYKLAEHAASQSHIMNQNGAKI